ncbi:MAG: FAD-dependent oxidoreductase [Anaerolineae bacterium]|nr:FAD-dependent oxidoreductase [Anaerolineae bacterium]
MSNTRYLIIGGGMTGAAAANGIREVDPDGFITIISSDDAPPYNRPPLSKKLWWGKTAVDDIFVKLPENVDLVLGREVVLLDADDRRVTDSEGQVYAYDKLLLATGGTPRHLSFGGDATNHYRTLDSYKALRADADHGAKFVVIGGGFIGSELAAALRKQGNEVTMVFPEPGICFRLFPAGMAAHVNDYYREQGVEVLNGESVADIETSAGGAVVVTGSGRRIPADRVVVGIGVTPNVALAEQAGLKVGNGIIVDRELRTSRDEIYAAGDVANYPDAILGEHRRVEHADAARAMGRAAGRNMAGAGEAYNYMPLFYSDLFDLGYEAVGQLDTRMDVIEDWKVPYQHGIIYYLKDGRVRGVMLVDVWDKTDAAREIIAKGAQETLESLRGRIEKFD